MAGQPYTLKWDMFGLLPVHISRGGFLIALQMERFVTLAAVAPASAQIISCPNQREIA